MVAGDTGDQRIGFKHHLRTAVVAGDAVHLLSEDGAVALHGDQTRPDIGLPVVKAIVPGMRGLLGTPDPRPLYDVPVALGRLATPTGYDELNPLPLFC